MEFKATLSGERKEPGISVLIESDWNLKKEIMEDWVEYLKVLIESDWNLKYIAINRTPPRLAVLIESDWTLKKPAQEKVTAGTLWY